MRHFIIFIFSLFIFCISTPTSTYAQSSRNMESASGKAKGSGSYSGEKRDAFSRKSKKGPNVATARGPRGSSRTKNYLFFISKKRIKGKKGKGFSNSKARHKQAKIKGGKGSSSGSKSRGGRAGGRKK